MEHLIAILFLIILILTHVTRVTQALPQKCYECAATQFGTATIGGVPNTHVPWSYVKQSYNLQRNPHSNDAQCKSPTMETVPTVDCNGKCFTLIINGALQGNAGPSAKKILAPIPIHGAGGWGDKKVGQKYEKGEEKREKK